MTTTVEETTITLPANVLKSALTAAVLIASVDSYLPVLNAVQITKIASMLVFRATDRYRLIRVTVALVDDVPDADWVTLLRVDECKQIIAAIPKAGMVSARLGVEDDKFGVAIEFGAAFRLTPLDGDFPKTDQIWPAPGSAVAVESMGFKPKHLTDIAKMPGRDKNDPIQFRSHGPTKPYVTEWSDGVTDYQLAHMPVKIED
jgi:DNA polymerase III sliding clamp (beta) subunit (PCNA family)